MIEINAYSYEWKDIQESYRDAVYQALELYKDKIIDIKESQKFKFDLIFDKGKIEKDIRIVDIDFTEDRFAVNFTFEPFIRVFKEYNYVEEGTTIEEYLKRYPKEYHTVRDMFLSQRPLEILEFEKFVERLGERRNEEIPSC